MTDVMCLVHCDGVTTFECKYNNKPAIGRIVKFSFNYHNQDPKHPNYNFFESTPGGSIEIHINNPEAGILLEPGKDYELTFHPKEMK